MKTLNKMLLAEVKQAFVPQPGGGGEPVAGASPMTAAMGAPMGGDPAAAGGDPNAAAAAGGDPNAAAMMPPPGLDPAMAGMMGGGAAPAAGGSQMSGTSMINITINDLIKLFKVFQQSSQPQAAAPAAAPAPAAAAGDPKLDEILKILKGAVGGGQ